MAENLVSLNDLQWLIKDATSLFSKDIIVINNNYKNKLEQIITIISELQNKIESMININMNTKYKTNRILTTKITAYDQQISRDDISVGDVYVQLTQIYYLMRTYLTGETIVFLENIEGINKVIEQKDWLAQLTGQNTTKYGTSYNKIFLLEESIKKLGVDIEKSEHFAKIDNYNELIENVIEAGTFRWSENKDSNHSTSSYRNHPLYKKNSRDDLVYAFYTGGKAHFLKLVYNASIAYNLGELQEELVKIIELNSMTENSLNNLLNSLQGPHPVGVILNNKWQRNSIPGLVEGDFRTATSQWVQSKRHNEKVITMLQIHNTIIDMKTYLQELQISLSTNSEEQLNEITDKFIHMFSSETENINEKIRKKIKGQLKLLGQDLLE